MKTAAAIVIDLIVIIWMIYTVWWLFWKHEPERPFEKKMRIFRFFTFLSNLLSAAAALVMLIAELTSGSVTGLPKGVMIFRFIGTASVSVTWLTVLVFLAPTIGTHLLWKEDNLFMHTIGPLLTMLSFILLENSIRFNVWYMFIGGLPVILYAFLYLYKVISVGEENGGWSDFYGFNRGGKWPVSFVIMICGGFLVSLVLILLHNMFV